MDLHFQQINPHDSKGRRPALLRGRIATVSCNITSLGAQHISNACGFLMRLSDVFRGSSHGFYIRPTAVDCSY